MKKKTLTVIFIALGLIAAVGAAALLYFVPVSFGGNSPQRPDPLDGDTMLTADEVIADRTQAIEYIESVHPYFIDGSDLAPYNVAKDSYIAATQDAMTVDELTVATAEYLTFFGDGHTRLAWPFGEELEIYHSYRDGHMYFADENGLTDKYIAAIDDIDVSTVFDTIDRIFPAENEMAVKINYDNYFTSSNLLRLAGVDITKDTFAVSLSDGSTVDCRYFVPDDNVSASDSSYYGNSCSMDGDIFVVNFVECSDDSNLKDIARQLRSAVRNGCSKVIIDARGNPGGSSNACERLLRAMGMSAPQYGMLIRYSEEAKEQKGYLRSKGSTLIQPTTRCRQAEDIDLVVLCDRFTYSSATMLCVYVRDGGLGTIIGEASSNMPNSYGDITYFALENSHIYASVSHKRFLRPSGDTSERMLTPDIETASADAYDRAVEFLNEQ